MDVMEIMEVVVGLSHARTHRDKRLQQEVTQIHYRDVTRR